MAKRVDPLKAKQARQKKMAIGGVVLLLALLAYQGPKTMKMLKGPQPVATSASAAPAPVATPGVTPATGATSPVGAAGETQVAAAADLTAVADSDLAPEAEQGQLATFERFSSKDPFAQQAEPVAKAPPPAVDPAAGTDTTPSDAKSGAGATDGTGGGAPATDGGGFTTGGSTPAAATLAAATSVSVNGVAEDVSTGASFPKDEPTFVLVKLAKNGKSVEIGIAGGEYAGGGETITLTLGKKLTLQNTADGSRYELELLTVQGFAAPKPKK